MNRLTININDIDKAIKIFNRQDSRIIRNNFPAKIRREIREIKNISREIQEIQDLPGRSIFQENEKDEIFRGVSIYKNSRIFIGISARKFDTSVNVEILNAEIIKLNMLKSVTIGKKEIFFLGKEAGSVRKLLGELIEERKNSPKDEIDIQARKDFRSVKYPSNLDREPIEKDDIIVVSPSGISVDYKTGKVKMNSKLKPGVHVRQGRTRGK